MKLERKHCLDVSWNRRARVVALQFKLSPLHQSGDILLLALILFLQIHVPGHPVVAAVPWQVAHLVLVAGPILTSAHIANLTLLQITKLEQKISKHTRIKGDEATH